MRCWRAIGCVLPWPPSAGSGAARPPLRARPPRLHPRGGSFAARVPAADGSLPVGSTCPGCGRSPVFAVRGRAVHPELPVRDSRQERFIGRRSRHPRTDNRWPVNCVIIPAKGLGSAQGLTGNRFGEFAYAASRTLRTLPHPSRRPFEAAPRCASTSGRLASTRHHDGEGPALFVNGRLGSPCRTLGGIMGFPNSDHCTASAWPSVDSVSAVSPYGRAFVSGPRLHGSAPTSRRRLRAWHHPDRPPDDQAAKALGLSSMVDRPELLPHQPSPKKKKRKKKLAGAMAIEDPL